MKEKGNSETRVSNLDCYYVILNTKWMVYSLSSYEMDDEERVICAHIYAADEKSAERLFEKWLSFRMK